MNPENIDIKMVESENERKDDPIEMSGEGSLNTSPENIMM
jgi:hypothetical protein